MTYSLYVAWLPTFVLAFSGLAMLPGCLLVSPNGAQLGSVVQFAEIVMSGNYILNEDDILRKSHVTPSVSTMSELVSQFNETGVEQAVRHFTDLINYSWASGDTIALDELSEERCTYCQSPNDSVTSLYEIGGWLRGLKYTVGQVEGDYPVNTNFLETA